MAQNLRQRLARIRDTERKSGAEIRIRAGDSPGRRGSLPCAEDECSWPGWIEAGFKTLKRVVYREIPFPPPSVFPPSLPVLVPDFFRTGKIPLPGELLFFDLETTGLSGGAGTLAFLAAFGRFAVSGVGDSVRRNIASARLEITQYLLLDYPGETDFIENAVKEFSSRPLPVVVSFNGKSFDSQILKTRCLMNGIMAPQYYHADLLHPARRLWKRMLSDCSQATIEVSVLGLDRSGDVPGALAPEIWFSFLRNGTNKELFTICDHNVRDITGLASIFLAFSEIAAEPLKSRNKFRFDEEALALAWNEAAGKGSAFLGNYEKETGERLLKSAAENGGLRAAFALALSFFRKGCYDEARAMLLKTAEAFSPDAVVSVNFRALVFKSLAVDAEWRLRNTALALNYTNSALTISELSEGFRNELEKRRTRLEEKQ